MNKQLKAIFLPPAELMNEFEKSFIVQAAKDVASTERHDQPDWFMQVKQALMYLINERNEAFKNL
jgi:hypothetical protein